MEKNKGKSKQKYQFSWKLCNQREEKIVWVYFSFSFLFLCVVHSKVECMCLCHKTFYFFILLFLMLLITILCHSSVCLFVYFPFSSSWAPEVLLNVFYSFGGEKAWENAKDEELEETHFFFLLCIIIFLFCLRYLTSCALTTLANESKKKRGRISL